MAFLRHSDLEGALEFLREAEAVSGPDPFPTELLDRLRALVPCDFVSYDELDQVEQRVLFYETCTNSHAAEDDEDLELDTFWRLKDQNPICCYHARTLNFTALKLSDFQSRRQLHRNEYYAAFLRPFGVEHQLVLGLPATLRRTKCFVLSSQRGDFDERDRAVLEVLRLHFPALYGAAAARRVAAAIAVGEDAPGELVVISSSGAIDFETAAARKLLARYFQDGRNGRLPEAIEAWLRQERSRLTGNDSPPSAAQPLTVRRDGAQLVIRRLDHILLLEEAPAGLTRREREIIGLLAEGRSNSEIASMLWIAPTTVRKHLENIYAKLGVHTRTAAVARTRLH